MPDKKYHIDNDSYKQYINSYNDFGDINVENSADLENKSEYEKIKLKLKAFDGVKTIKEARLLAKEIFNSTNEISFIKAGDANCTIISTSNLLRIVLNDNEEVVCYNYRRK